jgi:hypothetical protein
MPEEIIRFLMPASPYTERQVQELAHHSCINRIITVLIIGGGAGVSISGNNATIKITSNASANIKFEAGINYMILKMST